MCKIFFLFVFLGFRFSIFRAKKRKMAQHALVFYATGRPNENGELNYWSYVELEKNPDKRLAQLQQLVGGGNIEGLAPTNPKKPPCVEAYANECGLMFYSEEKEGFGRNDLAGGALLLLGFASIGQPLGCAYAGTVVVVGRDSKGLSAKQKQKLEAAIREYRDEDAESEEE